MFKVGDKVMDIHLLGEVGIVRARYRHHYLVGYASRKGWHRIVHGRESNLVIANSPITPKLLELERRQRELEKEEDEIYRQIEKLIRGG